MKTQTFTLTQPSAGLVQSRIWSEAFGALLLFAGAVQAAEPQPRVTEQLLELSQPEGAGALQARRHRQALETRNRKPYGSGYEARGLGESDTEVISGPSSQTAGSGRSSGGSAGSGGGSAGGAGGSGGGRGR